MLQIAVKNDTGFQGSISLNHKRLKRFSLLLPKLISITHLYSAERRRVERFIEQTFRASYNAEITLHYPALMSVHDEDDNILAALGFRYAKDEELFLENYLKEPIEKTLSKSYKEPISRSIISETGNLASKGEGASIFLFTALNAYLHQEGIEINSFTVTNFLYRYFKVLGMESITLAQADQSCLDDKGASWGSYYNENPIVIAGHVEQVLSGLRTHLQIILQTDDTKMQARLHHVSKSEVLTSE